MSSLQFPKLSARKAKKKKSVFWGIEVAETLRWHGWELGKEMIKHLILKNVHEKTQKLSYRCVGSYFLLSTTLLSHCIFIPPAVSVTLAPFLGLICPLSPWAVCWRQRVHAYIAGQKPANSDAQPLFLAGVFK